MVLIILLIMSCKSYVNINKGYEDINITEQQKVLYSLSDLSLAKLYVNEKNVNMIIEGKSLLHTAVLINIDIVKLLLDKGAIPDIKGKDGLTPLAIAVIADFKKIVELLLDRGAEVNESNSKEGITALMVAVIRKNQEMVEFLLSKGARINQKSNDGSTALRLAYSYNTREIVKFLLKKGAKD